MRIHLMTVVALLPAALWAQADTNKRLEAAAVVFEEVMEIADNAVPQALLDKAECAIVVPGLKKGAFFFGGKYGRGFIACRKSVGVGWAGLAGVRIEGGSFGLQIGGAESDVIMLVMNERGVQRLMSSRFTLGGDASVAAGPVGRSASAQTDALMTAEILTWSRSRGAFAGISLQGATLRQDQDVNKDMYGKPYLNKDVVRSELAPPKAGERLVSMLNKYSGRKGS